MDEITILYPDGSRSAERVNLDDRPGYRELCWVLADWIDGNIEHVRVFSEQGEYVSMFVDEDFIEKGLPINPEATIEYERNLRVHNPALLEELGSHPIQGVAVLFTRNVWF